MHSLVRDHMIRLSNVYTLLRQASEWGMRGLQSVVGRLELYRTYVLCTVHTYFWRARLRSDARRVREPDH
jgi:hypothetical protein